MVSFIFFGTGAFAVPSLNALAADARFEVLGVVTQPDRPVGRHAVMTPPPVKQTASELGINEILQPEKVSDASFQERIKSLGPACDIFVVISYGKILPQWLINLPQRGVINVHGSLLPRWRGPSPIQAAIAAGDEKTGVSIMKIDALMDHGPVLASFETPIGPQETARTLHDRLAEIGAKELPNTIANYLAGTIVPQEQDHAMATVCGVLTREDGKIDWSQSADVIERQVRAYTPWPGCWTVVDGRRLKIHEARACVSPEASPSARIIHGSLPAIGCGHGTALQLIKLQFEGKPITDGKNVLSSFKSWIS